MSTQYRLVQSGKTASGGCSAGPRFVRAVAPRIYLFIYLISTTISYLWKESAFVLVLKKVVVLLLTFTTFIDSCEISGSHGGEYEV
jgi:hypothetical protein